MKRFPWLVALSIAALSLSPTQVAEAQRQRDASMSLTVGQQRTVPARNVRNYSPGAPGIIDIRVLPDGSEFVIVALAPGETSLLLIYENGDQLRYDIDVIAAPAGDETVDSPGPPRVVIPLDH
jgi:hypothetical protein